MVNPISHQVHHSLLNVCNRSSTQNYPTSNYIFSYPTFIVLSQIYFALIPPVIFPCFLSNVLPSSQLQLTDTQSVHLRFLLLSRCKITYLFSLRPWHQGAVFNRYSSGGKKVISYAECVHRLMR